LSPQYEERIQSAAVATLGRIGNPRVPEMLLAGWKSYGPSLRLVVLDTLLRRAEWVPTILQAIEQQQIAGLEIDAARRQQLLDLAPDRERTRKLLAGSINSDRQKVLDDYQAVRTLTGDASRGQQVFAKTCAACHRIGSVGTEVGPDLPSLTDKSPEALLVAVLDPNRAVEAKYVNYLAVTRNGLTLTGLLTNETGNSITLIGADGKPQPILRDDLESLQSTGRSAMPDGLEKDLPPQAMADLFAFLRGSAPAIRRNVFPGNHPEVIKPGADGVLLLPATKAEIYGMRLVFETEYQNLGYWNDDQDHAVWTVDVPQAGKYSVWLDYACHPNTAGNLFLIETGGQKLTGKVAGTENWDTYRQSQAGEVTLAAGQQRLTMRSLGKVKGSLIDLRSLRLVKCDQ
jgi:putative heme-binding domain-containing protein